MNKNRSILGARAFFRGRRVFIPAGLALIGAMAVKAKTSPLTLSGVSPAQEQPAVPMSAEKERVERVLHEQAKAWNAGDIEGFMRGYWNSPELTFSSGGRVTRGWKGTLDGFKSRYPDRAAMGRLTFTNLETTLLAPEAALVLGNWNLERENPVGGVFTVVFRKIDGAWLMVHDHTSVRTE